MDEEIKNGNESLPEAAEPPKKKKKKAVVVTVILLAVLVLCVGGAYLYMADYFKDHFYSGTLINGTDVSGQTVEQVKAAIKKDVAKYELTITERDGVTETLSSEDVGWAYVDDHKVDDLMNNQDRWEWFLAMTKSKKSEVNVGTSYDKTKTESAIAKLKCLQDMTAPKDAVLVENEDGASITKEVVGNQIDKDKLTQQVEAALDAGKNECSIIDPDCYIYPKIYSDDKDLTSRMDQWNKFLSIEITYAFGDNSETIGKSSIAAAMTDDGKEVKVSTDWVRPLVGTWADKYNTFGRERTFKTHLGKTVTLPAYTKNTGEKDSKTGEPLTHTSDYGWLLDSDKTAADLISAIEKGESGTRQPIFKYSAMGWDNGDLTGTYVEVSLSEQHLWCYKNYEVVMSTDIVTGAPTAERQTYPGCYAIDAKKSPATLGTLDTQGYSSPVNWWCPFDGGRGLHDAPWRTEFGGNIYQTNGSHGCVNIPQSNMEAIYKAVSIGTAVCVY